MSITLSSSVLIFFITHKKERHTTRRGFFSLPFLFFLVVFPRYCSLYSSSSLLPPLSSSRLRLQPMFCVSWCGVCVFLVASFGVSVYSTPWSVSLGSRCCSGFRALSLVCRSAVVLLGLVSVFRVPFVSVLVSRADVCCSSVVVYCSVRLYVSSSLGFV